MRYTVRAGDYLSKIAAEHGFANWRTIYDHPDNAPFRDLRPNPNLIYPGDQLIIPDASQKSVTATAGSEARFCAHRAHGSLDVTLLDFTGAPLANVPGTLTVEGADRPIVTDAGGRLVAAIPPHLTHAYLSIQGVQMTFRIGELNPMNNVDPGDVSGVQGRLANLGFYGGAIDGALSDDTREAIRAFQSKHELEVTGDISRALEDRLHEVHGS